MNLGYVEFDQFQIEFLKFNARNKITKYCFRPMKIKKGKKRKNKKNEMRMKNLK